MSLFIKEKIKLRCCSMNKKGEAELLFIFMITVLLFVISHYFQFSLQSLERMETRSKTYLCFRIYKRNLSSLISLVGKTNQTIRGLFPLTLVPKTSVMAKSAIKSLQVSQNLKLLDFQKRILSSDHCSALNAVPLARAHPYLTVGSLKFLRDKTEAVQIGRNKWQALIMGSKKNLILIRVNLSIKSSYSKSLTFSAKEELIGGKVL